MSGGGAKPKVCTKRFIIKLKKGEIDTKGVNGIKREKREKEKKKEIQNAFC